MFALNDLNPNVIVVMNLHPVGTEVCPPCLWVLGYQIRSRTYKAATIHGVEEGSREFAHIDVLPRNDIFHYWRAIDRLGLDEPPGRQFHPFPRKPAHRIIARLAEDDCHLLRRRTGTNQNRNIKSFDIFKQEHRTSRFFVDFRRVGELQIHIDGGLDPVENFFLFTFSNEISYVSHVDIRLLSKLPSCH